MYTKCTETNVKESIISPFCLQSSPLRIVIATIAFGMGLDSPFVRQVIHWGPSDTIEDYVQEMGHCGCDGKLACSRSLFAKANQQSPKKGRIEYCKNTVQCRRNLLYQDFDDADNITAPPTKCTCCESVLNIVFVVIVKRFILTSFYEHIYLIYIYIVSFSKCSSIHC